MGAVSAAGGTLLALVPAAEMIEADAATPEEMMAPDGPAGAEDERPARRRAQKKVERQIISKAKSPERCDARPSDKVVSEHNCQ